MSFIESRNRVRDVEVNAAAFLLAIKDPIKQMSIGIGYLNIKPMSYIGSEMYS